MAKQNSTRSKEPDFADLVFEVQKLNTARFAGGKSSEEYKKQHTVSVKLISTLNNIYGKGYASLSKAQAGLSSRYIREKEETQRALEKAIKNKKGA